MERICWGRSTSCFIYNFVIQVINKKALMMMMMIMMNCFWVWCQRSLLSRMSDTPQVGFEPVQNLSSEFVEWSCAEMVTTTPRCHCIAKVLLAMWQIFLHENNPNFNSYRFKYKFAVILFLLFLKNQKQESSFQQVGGPVTRNVFVFCL